MSPNPSPSFLGRHEFLLRRLHSLTGLIPIGAYLMVHLTVNASLLGGPTSFQKNVYQIHGLEDALVVVEWAFIFLPILFHGLFGIMIVWSGVQNTGQYAYCSNVRYALQRATGLLAFAFVIWHVFHLHGWFHGQWWLENVAQPLQGANFRPFNAASTLGLAMKNLVVQVLYAAGVLSCVYHLANGIWTMGITWGVWTSAAAQRRASWVCGLFGAGLATIGMAALVGASTVDIEKARAAEGQMYEVRVSSGEIKPNQHKRSEPAPQATGQGRGPVSVREQPPVSGSISTEPGDQISQRS